MRIAIGGFHHETNTFAPTPATYEMFERADGWPRLGRGAEIIDLTAGVNIPVSGFVTAATAAGHELVPLVWCNAPPCAAVTANAYERIAGMMLEELAGAGPIDAMFLDLHGAMVTQHLEDGEGELLRRIRAVVGPELPLVVALDLHANVTRAMVEAADAMVVYRTYPHIDMAETGARCFALLERIVREGKPAKAFRQIPFLVSINWQCTTIEPARSIYARMAALEDGEVLSTSIAQGFPPADIHDCGPSVLAYGRIQAAADAAADRIAADFNGQAAAFDGRLWAPEDAVHEAMRLAAATPGKPAIIADTQDNPGGGGDGDTTGMLKALVAAGASDAVFGLLCDPAAAAAAHAAGQGAVLSLGLGGRSGIPADSPFETTVAVERLGDGQFLATGPFYGGNHMRLGAMALLRIANTSVRVVVCSQKVQAADQAMFRHVGVEPGAARVLVLKSSVHFRADFGPLASGILVAVAPGAVIADPAVLPYRRLRAGMRLGPSGPVFGG